VPIESSVITVPNAPSGTNTAKPRTDRDRSISKCGYNDWVSTANALDVMARPSLTSTPAGLAAAKQALAQKGLTQVKLGQELKCSRQPISNFFSGKAIEQRLYLAICDRLGLDWQETAGMGSSAVAPTSIERQIAPTQSPDIHTLVKHCRERVHAEIMQRCGPIRILGLNHPIDLEAIYTHVKVLEKISAYRWQTVDDLMAETKIDEERWSLGKVNLTRIAGIDALDTYQRVILLGKPGAGKSTFLHHLAVEGNRGKIAADRVPILLTLKDWVQTDLDLSLLDYIARSYKSDISIAEWTQVLQAGKGLVLLDGLDEIPQAQSAKILDRLRTFVKEFGDNQIVISCRIAAWEDTYGFERFAEVELADFDDEQIAKFTDKWFGSKPNGAELAISFWHELAENPELKELVVTPILLSLVCLAFEDLGTCPQTRAKLYQVGIEILLTKWDDRRGIDRAPVYEWLSTAVKVKLLAQIAFRTFQDRQYFFAAAVVERYILEFLAAEIPALEYVQIDARSILRSIVVQHGLLVERARDIYSFSHLTFHEYFVARYLIPIPTQAPPPSSIEILLARLDDGSTWREIWLLAVELLSKGDLLLAPLQDNIRDLVISNPALGKYLRDEIPHLVPELDKIQPKLSPQACLALRFDIDFDLDHNRTIAFALDPRSSIFVVASFYRRMLVKMELPAAIETAESDLQGVTVKTANEAMGIAIEHVWQERSQLPLENRRKLEDLTSQFVGKDDSNGLAIGARNIARDRCRFGDLDRKSAAFKIILKQYYYRVGIIVECLQNRDCQISPKRRQELLDTLFVSNAPAICQSTGRD